MDPVTATAAAATTAAVADFATGLISGHSSKSEGHKNRQEARRQFNIQDDYNKNLTQYRVEDALKAGINPLAALGQSTNYSPTASIYGGGSDSSIPSTSGIAKAISKFFERESKEDAEYNRKTRSLDLEGRQLENDYRRAQIDALRNGNTGQPVSPPDQLFNVALDLAGRPRLVIDQNVLEADDDNPGYKASMVNALGHIDPKTGRIPEQARMMIDDWYYQKHGYHIPNLEELYISPTEAGIVTAGMFKTFVDTIRGR